MKKVMFFIGILLIHLLLTQSVFGITGSNFDARLVFLLGDEGTPFFPDTVRWDFLEYGMQKCAMMSDAVCQVKREVWVGANNAEIFLWYCWNGYVKKVLAVWLKDENYALMHIRQRDVGLKKIASSEPLRYWYERGTQELMSGETPTINVYPDNGDANDTLEIFASYVPMWGDTSCFHPAFENEVVLWALYLCKLRQGEHEVANFIRQIAINEILDLKAILENRPVDVTIAKEVVPR